MAQVRTLQSRAGYLLRHLRAILPYLTIRKLINLLQNELEFRLSRTSLRSTPPFLKIEATPLCHLSCDGCPHRSTEYKRSLNKNMHLSIGTVERLVNPIAANLIGASLSYSGEPLLNRNLAEIVRFLHSRNICTSFATNLSIPMTAKQADALILSGLDQILISLDGTSEETYLQYRFGGNYFLVLKNVRLLADRKAYLRAARPILIWKMIIFDHNRHEIDAAIDGALPLGFDGVEFVADNRAVRDESGSGRKTPHYKCFWAWNTAVIAWDGVVQPCCMQINEMPMGSVERDDFRAIWNSKLYVELRKSFVHSDETRLWPTCVRCLGLKQSDHQPD